MMARLEAFTALLWHDAALYGLLAVGVLFTLWSGFGQYRALTHGAAVLRGRYDRADAPGALTHMQALSAALSATVGLGNIAGVALAVSLGGPGAVFWMWVTGVVGMALKMTEVIQSMLYRNVEDPDNPHGGPMWVARRGFAALHPALAPVGVVVGGLFCITLLVSTVTGGNMFQAWNVADISREYFGMPLLLTGAIQALLVGAVILGGIQRIGTVAGRLVPFMCGVYLLAGLAVVGSRIDQVPDMLRMIVVHAFSPQEAGGAFLGATFGWVFLIGMRRALFSNEAGQGSAPIAHAAARTDEPVREGVVAGLEPFIDTLVVCTVTALVILTSGVWNRAPDLAWPGGVAPAVVAATADGAPTGARSWTLEPVELPPAMAGDWRDGHPVFAVLVGDAVPERGADRHRLAGTVERRPAGAVVVWETIAAERPPGVAEPGLYRDLKGATLTAKAFERSLGPIGALIVPLTAWLFAVSTMISWSYYGEQGVVYLAGSAWVRPYRLVYCALILVACSPLIRTEAELDTLSSLGTGVMLLVNIPIMLLFGGQAMRAYHGYVARLRAGAFETSR